MFFLILDGRILMTPNNIRPNTASTAPHTFLERSRNTKRRRSTKQTVEATVKWAKHPLVQLKHGQILMPLKLEVCGTPNSAVLSGGAAAVVHSTRSSAAFVLSLHSLMIALSLPLPPPPPPSHFLFLPPPSPPSAGVLLSFV